ncbi:MAG: hypothetical protein WCK89_01595 [bacterium]
MGMGEVLKDGTSIAGLASGQKRKMHPFLLCFNASKGKKDKKHAFFVKTGPFFAFLVCTRSFGWKHEAENATFYRFPETVQPIKRQEDD